MKSPTLLFPVLFCLSAFAAPLRAQLPDDTHWFYEYGGPSSDPFVLTIQGDYLYMGGLFLRVDNDEQKKNFTRFNLLTEGWERIPGINSQMNGGVWAIHGATDGSVYLGGNFSNVSGTVSSAIARFDPATATFSALTDPSPSLVTAGQENGPTNGRVFAIVQKGNLLYVGGEFTGPGGSPQNEKYIRSFNLSTRQWQRVGAGLNSDVRALALAPNGDLIAGGQFTGALARWDGSTWSVIGGGMGGGSGGTPIVRALAVALDGTIYAGGDFDAVNASGSPVTVRDVAAYQSGSWNALAGGFDEEYRQSNGTNFNSDGVYDLAIRGNGPLYAAGDFDASAGRAVLNLRHVALWDGTGAWKSLGSGVGTTGSQIVNCLALGPKADLYAGGVFNIGYGTLGAPAKNFARWMPARDFTGYIPGAADNTTSRLVPTAADARDITLLTRPGTSYIIQSSGTLGAWGDITGTAFTGTGSRQGFGITGSAAQRYYRFRATDY